MNNLTPEEILILGTIIALELVKCKTDKEIKVLKAIVGQILCSLSNYLSL